MFVKAVEASAKFTRPLIITSRLWDGSIRSGLGAMVIVNPDGWMVTAAHIVADVVKQNIDAPAIDAHKKRIAGLGDKQIRAMKIAPPDPAWITNSMLWLPFQGVTAQAVMTDAFLDLAIARMVGFDPSWVAEYPMFKADSSDMKPGTSLCRLGYPFSKVAASFDVNTQTFDLQSSETIQKVGNNMSVPMFPLDGIHTRVVNMSDPATGRDVKFVETSTPGLGGHSGGPVFDTSGTVWGIQSRTQHYDLEWSVAVERKGKKLEEAPTFHVGWAVHSEIVMAFLKQNGVTYESACGRFAA